VLKADGDVPPIQHDRGMGQRLALQPPQPGIAIADPGLIARHGRRITLGATLSFAE